MERFEYRVLGSKMHGVFQGDWFDGDENLGKEISSELLNRYGAEGWEACATVRDASGHAMILLKRRLAA